MNNEGSGQTNPTQPPNNAQLQWKPFVPIVNIDNGPDFKNKSTELVKEIEDIIKGNGSSGVTPTNQDKEVMQIAHSALEIRAYSMGIITYFVSNSLILPSRLFTWANLTPKARSFISFGTGLIVAAYGRFNTPPFTILEAYLSLNSDLGKYARERSMQTFPSASYFNQKYNPPMIVPNQEPQPDYNNSSSTSHHHQQQYTSPLQRRNEGFAPQSSSSPYGSGSNDYNSPPNPYNQPSYQSYDHNGGGYSYKEGTSSSYSPSYSSHSSPPITTPISKRDASKESFDDRFDDSYANRSSSSSSSYYEEDQLYSEPDDLDEYSGSSESEFERMNRLRREKLLSRSR